MHRHAARPSPNRSDRSLARRPESRSLAATQSGYAGSMDARGDAWDAVHEALPARGTVGQATVSDPLTRTWSVTARGPHPGRGKAPQTVTGTGEDETAALRDLDARLRGVPQPDGGRMNELSPATPARLRRRGRVLDAGECRSGLDELRAG